MARNTRRAVVVQPEKASKSSVILATNIGSATKTVKFDTVALAAKPVATNLNGIFKACRAAREESDFLSRFLPIKRSVYNFGFKLKPQTINGKKPDQKAIDSVGEWLQEEANFQFNPWVDPQTGETIQPEYLATNAEVVNKYVEECWDEWLLLDNLVAMWLDSQGYPNTLPPERCQYVDVVGVPLLRFQHGLSFLDIQKLPVDQQERFKKYSAVLLDPGQGEHFKVLKRARIGEGFGVPNIYSVLRLLNEIESKQMGMQQMAFMMRRVVRLHKLGHKIDSGDRAGKPLHFWKKERAEAVMKLWRDSDGIADQSVNFDHEIEYPWPDLKLFDQTAFEGSNARLMDWAGPLALMLAAKGVMPYLTPILRSQAEDDRRKIKDFFTVTINNAFSPPVPVEVHWSNTIFNESRLAAEMTKFAAQVGWISATTGMEELGFDSDQESDNKVLEASDPDAVKKFTPLFDVSHGSTPALGETAGALAKAKATGPNPGAKNGRPSTST